MTNRLQNIGGHKERHDLTGEHFLGDAGQILFAILFFGIWIIDTFFLKYTTFINQYVSIYIRLPVGIVLLCISCYLSKAGLSIVFGEVRKESCVIRKGVFNIVRHPIYLGEILLYLGLLLISISLASVIIWIIVIIFLHYISRHEERLLLKRFGDDYKLYKAEVPMWIPWPW